MPSIPVSAIDQALGSWLHRMRLELELSQAQLASDINDLDATLHWRQSTVSKLESGQRCLYTPELIALATWSGQSTDELIATVRPRRRRRR